MYVGFPRYYRGLRLEKMPRIPKPRITMDHCFRPFNAFLPLKIGRDLWAHQIKCFMYQILILIAPNIYLEKTPN